MEAKPILIVKVDNSKGQFSSLHEINKMIQVNLYDYHVLSVPFVNENEPIQFQVFYPKDFQEVNFEELREIIKNLNK